MGGEGSECVEVGGASQRTIWAGKVKVGDSPVLSMGSLIELVDLDGL